MQQFTRRMLSLVATLAIAAAAGACSDDDPVGPSAPATPTGLTAERQLDGTIEVSWNASAGAESYLLERALETAPSAFTAVGSDIDGTSYTDDTAEPETDYRYRVAAQNSSGTSAFSTAVTAGEAVAVLEGDITADRTLFSDTLYILRGYVKVQNGVELTIQPGTRIVGDFDVKGSSLWILRGARLTAIGTASEPIVFTSAQPESSRNPGDWGGIIMVGNGVSNRAGVIETEGPAGVTEVYSGGTDNTDNSGTLRYVRIEFAGYDVTGTGQELNALSSYAIGSGTTYEYIQTLAGLDDSFEFWGGAVDGRYLASYESGDDHFDWSEGYRGRLQFLIAFQSTRLAPAAGTGQISGDPQGIEADGCPATDAGCTDGNATEPLSIPVLANFTIIGPAAPVAMSSSGDVGIVLRRGTGGYLTHGFVANWQRQGISVRDAQTDANMTADSLAVVNMLFAGNATTYDADGGSNFGTAAAFASSNHTVEAGAITTLLQSLDPGAASFLQPVTGSAAAGVNNEVALPTEFLGAFFGGTLTPADYYGAIAPTGTPWTAGWTYYAAD